MYDVVANRPISLDREYAAGEIIEEKLEAEALTMLLSTRHVLFAHDRRAPKATPNWLKDEAPKEQLAEKTKDPKVRAGKPAARKPKKSRAANA